MSKFDIAAKVLWKTVFLAVQLIAVITVISIIYGFIADGHFTLFYVFTWNFVAAAVVIAAGLVIWFMPARLAARFKKSKLIDHTTYKDEIMEERRVKQVKGLEIICIGIAATLITALVELVIWLIVVGV